MLTHIGHSLYPLNYETSFFRMIPNVLLNNLFLRISLDIVYIRVISFHEQFSHVGLDEALFSVVPGTNHSQIDN